MSFYLGKLSSTMCLVTVLSLGAVSLCAQEPLNDENASVVPVADGEVAGAIFARDIFETILRHL